MATPDIGRSISEGYQRGMNRLAGAAPSVLVPALAVAVVAGIIGEAQSHFSSVSLDFQGSGSHFTAEVHQSAGDRAIYNLLGAVQQFVITSISWAALAVFAGAFHRERHGEEAGVPAPGAMTSALSNAFARLLPKLWIVVGLGVVGPIASMIHNGLGALVSLIALIGTVYFGVRWLFAPVIVGGAEAAHDEAYARSEEVVAGSFWPYFGIMLVVGLATLAPAAIVGTILGVIVHVRWLSFAVAMLVIAFAMFTVFASALESMWAQIEDGGATHPPSDAFYTPTATPHDEPAADADDDSDPYA